MAGFMSPENSSLFTITPLKAILILLGIAIILYRIDRDMKNRTGSGLFDNLWE